jgi:glycosyltransferase involved in cell wall biosynthesis
MTGSRVTVLMSVFNGEKFLHQAIESILSQSFTNFEFLIIDDGSTDRSQEIILSYNDDRIRLICNRQNIGLTKSLNRGLAESQGEYIARMDADDISLPKRLERLVGYLDSHPDVSIVGTGAEKINGNSEIIGLQCPQAEPEFIDFLDSNQVIHGSILARKKVLKAIGGYPVQFRLCQDYALFLKIAKNHKIRNLQEILYQSRTHNQSITINNFEKSIAYHIVAIRYANNEKIDTAKYPFNGDNIRDLIESLNSCEKEYYHNARVSFLLMNGNLKLARSEYWQLFKIPPHKLIYLINFLRTNSGITLMNLSTKIYLRLLSCRKY